MNFRKMPGVIMGSIDAIIRSLARVSCVLASIMGIIVFMNVFGRYLLHKPLIGTVELVEVIMLLICFFTISYGELIRGHVVVDVVTSRLSRRIRAIMGSFALFLSTGIIAVIAYESTVYAILTAHDLNKATILFHIPHAFLWCVMALGCLLLCLRLLANIFHPLPPEKQKGALIE